jgi:hypothetical protein
LTRASSWVLVRKSWICLSAPAIELGSPNAETRRWCLPVGSPRRSECRSVRYEYVFVVVAVRRRKTKTVAKKIAILPERRRRAPPLSSPAVI